MDEILRQKVNVNVQSNQWNDGIALVFNIW